MTNTEKIINEAKRIEEDSLYSAKGHFCTGQRWNRLHLWLGTISVAFSAIAGASALSQFDYHNVIAGVISIIVAGLTAVITFINPNDRASIHRRSGNMYSSLKNDARIFYDIEVNKLDDKKAVEDLKILNNRRSKLNLESQIIPDWAFKKARKGIENGEAKYKIDS